jgi:hypothetical protein
LALARLADQPTKKPRLRGRPGGDVCCSEQGPFVGPTPLLERVSDRSGRTHWRTRLLFEINRDLGPASARPAMTTETRLPDFEEKNTDKDVALVLLTLAKSIDDTIGKLNLDVEKITDDSLKSQFNRAVGNLIGYVAREFIFPIEHLYPDLVSDD